MPGIIQPDQNYLIPTLCPCTYTYYFKLNLIGFYFQFTNLPFLTKNTLWLINKKQQKEVLYVIYLSNFSEGQRMGMESRKAVEKRPWYFLARESSRPQREYAEQ